MRDKYFRIGSGTRLMSVVSFNSIWTPVRYDGYVEVGDMVDGIDYLIGELNDYGELSIFHNVEGESMLDLVCSFLGMSKVDDLVCSFLGMSKVDDYLVDYRFSFPLKSENGHEYDEVSIGKCIPYDDIKIDCDRRLYVLSNLDSRKGLVEFLECLKGLVEYGEFKRYGKLKSILSIDKVVEWCCMFLLSCSLFYLLFFLLLVLFYYLSI